MTNREYHRLMGYYYAAKNRPSRVGATPSRRLSKSMGTATGQVLKNSRVVTGVNIERIFVQYK